MLEDSFTHAQIADLAQRYPSDRVVSMKVKHAAPTVIVLLTSNLQLCFQLRLQLHEGVEYAYDL